MKVETKKLQGMRGAFVRHTGPHAECGTAWETLTSFLGAKGWVGGDSLHIGLCYDDPEITSPEKLRNEACVTVKADFDLNDPEGTAAEDLITDVYAPLQDQ